MNRNQLGVKDTLNLQVDEIIKGDISRGIFAQNRPFDVFDMFHYN